MDSELPETTDDDELTVQDILDAAQADGLEEDLERTRRRRRA